MGEDPTRQHSMKCPKLHGKECKCDGYHTFDELYDHRISLFISLCKQQKKTEPPGWCSQVWRSKLHSDGKGYDGWYIMGIGKAAGVQISYHLPLSTWEQTSFAETLETAPEWDGHSPDDVLQRLKLL
jgi:hypothetical protein